MARPKVSVVIATFNYGRFLGDALESVRSQSFNDLECIIVDDASTDDTASVVESFTARDERFKYIRLETNVGVAAARNRGLAIARGEYLQLLDADDVLAPNKLAVHAGLLGSTPEIAVVYSDYYRFTDDPHRSTGGGYKADEKLSGPGKSVLARLIAWNIFRLNTVLFRSAVLQDVGAFREEFRYVEDWDLWLRIAASGHSFAYVDDPTARAGVRSNAGSLSSDLPSMRRFQLQVRQNLWTEGRLAFLDRIRLLLRSADFYLRMLLIHREPIILLEKRKHGFLLLLGITAILILPFWIVWNVLVRPIRKNAVAK